MHNIGMPGQKLEPGLPSNSQRPILPEYVYIMATFWSYASLALGKWQCIAYKMIWKNKTKRWKRYEKCLIFQKTKYFLSVKQYYYMLYSLAEKVKSYKSCRDGSQAGPVEGCKQPELPSNFKMTNVARRHFRSYANLAPFYHKQLTFCKLKMAQWKWQYIAFWYQNYGLKCNEMIRKS